ncbi:ATP-binding protein [Mariprofundus sp. KV]|uniref:hybrid sensor histidine kinase/response regulator n=1 Tax=Mariprofundus sp. KV TaxID=2608715 RepID=UPI001F506D16|nr:ATP-binding protein [Mariprofundus sp. KV]
MGNWSRIQHSVMQMDPLLLTMLVSIPFVFIFATINFTLGLFDLSQIEFLMVLTLSALYWWARKGSPSSTVLKHLYILHPVILFAFLFLQGGYSDIGFIWSLGLPFVACLSAGSRIGLAWTVIYALIIVVLGIGSEEIVWQKLVYIGLGYFAFTLVAVYTVLSREKSEELKGVRLNETSSLLRQGEIALSESKVSHRQLLDAMPHAIALHSDGKWIYCNINAAILLGADGAEEVIGSSLFDYIDASDHGLVLENINRMSDSGRPIPLYDIHIVRKDGSSFAGSLLSSPVRIEGIPAFLVSLEDATERMRQDEEHYNLKTQLEHAQRLESLGVLAGGIAHDFNNLLAAISGNAELAIGKAEPDSPLHGYIENIVGTCDHAAELCKQMLAYAGKGSYELEVLNLNEMVKSMGKLIRASVSSNISLKMKLDSHLPGIEGDMAQIQQLILNFIVNSADAIGKEPGEIKVSTGFKHIDRNVLDRMYNGSELDEGEFVAIEIRDNGCGIDPEMQTKIFDPFFTTKETGSGLGLSAVLGIVCGHKGAIQMFSEPGKGTAFRVYLPATNQAVKEKMVTTMEVEAWRGDGRVLVVDDDLRVRSVACSFIEMLNFDVLTADDGKEGLEQFAQHHHDLVAVLLDMTMPVLGGVEAMAGMRQINPHVPIILVSGYSEVEAGTLVCGDRPDAFLQKPFKAKELKTVLYEVMHKPA